MLDLDKLLQDNSDSQKEINRMTQEIYKLKNKIKENKKNIYILCEHDWEKDRGQMNERTTYTCLKCELDKNNYY